MKIKHVGLNSTVITFDGIKAGWEPADATRDDADGHNRHQYSIVRSTVKELWVLVRKTKGRSV